MSIFSVLQCLRGEVWVRRLGLDHFAAAQAGSADAHALSAAAYLRANWAQIDIPAPLAHVVGVADVVTGERLLAADFTYLCHRLLQRFGTDG